MPNYKNEQFNFLRITKFFAIAGFFIPGFTVVALLGIQKLFELSGMDCENALKSVWWLCTVGSIGLPIIFLLYLNRKTIIRKQDLDLKVGVFNLLEYIFIQAALEIFFSNPDTLCNVTDGQNGIELVFTGWLAIPFLFILGFIFNKQKVIVEYF
ncbi:hypothetical protein [Dyadobacter frigoris]|uniref:Uncharacterized protein n=1 Tax=Dyadobacter frigoris TaxID=2576211 RepID=A0A4U6D872_9BACT|nr:hypothetical protein [Dyadobacter frigoris]TKT92521.1 hypothetical protein FDK13_11215 [Dyadobacter frigoris]GLU55315.1 hypothetical protein Dfri01_47760 [Dyadobacter frigoris]